MLRRYRLKKLEIPSLCQGNVNNSASSKWCGRTTAAMIYNYYKLVEDKSDQFVRNQQDQPPYNLVTPDGAEKPVGYMLRAALVDGHASGWPPEPVLLWPESERGGYTELDESACRTKLAPVLSSLEMNNPVLFYSSLSSLVHDPMHIVVISGYKIAADGCLWLHVDDPGRSYKCSPVLRRRVGNEFIEPVDFPEQGCKYARPGCRYWIKAWKLFQRNGELSPQRPNDLWCDHSDRPGFAVYYNIESPTPSSPASMAIGSGATFPMALPQVSAASDRARQLRDVWDMVRTARAPYPFGRLFAWHDGAHFVQAAANKGHEPVFPMGPGEIVFARSPYRVEKEDERDPKRVDTNFVLVRHWLDKDTLSLVDVEAAAEREGNASLATFYSLYMHLKPLEPQEPTAKLEDERIRDAVADALATYKPESGQPEPKVSDFMNPQWVRHALQEEVPALEHFFTPDKPAGFFVFAPDGKASQLIPRQAVRRKKGMVWEDQTVRISHRVLGPDEGASEPKKGERTLVCPAHLPSNLDALPDSFVQDPLVPAQTALAFYNPVAGELISTSYTPARSPRYEVLYAKPPGQGDGNKPELSIFRHEGHEYAGVRRDDVAEQGRELLPGFQLDRCAHLVLTHQDLRALKEVNEKAAAGTLLARRNWLNVRVGSKETRMQTKRTTTYQLFRVRAGAAPLDLDLVPCAWMSAKSAARVQSYFNNPGLREPGVPAGNPLCYFDRETQRLHQTGLTVGADCRFKLDLRGRRFDYLSGSSRGGFVEILAYQSVSANQDQAGIYHWRSPPEILDRALGGYPADKRFLLLDVDQRELYLTTQGRRFFPDDTKVENLAVAGRLYAIDRYATTAGKLRAWVDLHPCVALSETEKKRCNKEMADRSKTPNGQTLERLRSDQSMLLGVDLEAGWALKATDKGTAVVASDWAIKGQRHLRLYHALAPDKARDMFRYYVRWRGAQDLSVPEMFLVQASESLELRAVATFKKGARHRALVEAQIQVDNDHATSNAEEREAAEARNQYRDSLFEVLIDPRNQVVDIATLRKNQADQLKPEHQGSSGLATFNRVDFQPIGRMGSLGRGKTGVHFEIFSGENVLPERLMKAGLGMFRLGPTKTETGDLLDREFFKQELCAIFGDNAYESLNTDPASEKDVVTPKEWLDFTAPEGRSSQQLEVYRERYYRLAQSIAVHPSEWSIDWEQENTNVKAWNPALPESCKANRWLTDDIELDSGTKGNKLHFYHPVLFIELLSTGLDLHFVMDGEARDAPPERRVKLRVRGVEEDLAELNPSTYVLRLLLGGPSCDSVLARYDAEWEDVAYKNKPVRIHRGSVTDIWLAEPGLDLDLALVDRKLDYAVPVYPMYRKADNAGDVYLLPDGNTKLANTNYSAYAVTTRTTYNYEKPDRVEYTFTGAGKNSFDFVSHKKAEGNAWYRIFRLWERITGKHQPAPVMSVPIEATPMSTESQSYHSATATKHVIAKSDAEDEASAQVVATVYGKDDNGDLSGARWQKRSVKINTRLIKAGVPGGADIAKLQVYLSQIIGQSRRPCYRYYRRNLDYDPATKSCVVTDGFYGQGMAMALWRFIWTFAGGRDWNRKASLKVTDAGGTKEASLSFGHYVPAHGDPETMRKDADDRPLEVAAAMLKHNKVDDTLVYPVVERWLLDAIVAAFRCPNIRPQVHPSVAVDLPPDSATARSRLDQKGLGTIFPFPASRIHITASCKEPGELAVNVEVAEESAYRVLDAKETPQTRVQTTLEKLLDGGITLSCSGKLTTRAASNRLRISSHDGYELGGVTLGGARELLASSRQAGRDAAWLQYYLAHIKTDPTKAKSKPFYQGTIDGQWGGGSAKALDRFRKAHCTESETTYKQIVDKLIKVYKAQGGKDHTPQ